MICAYCNQLWPHGNRHISVDPSLHNHGEAMLYLWSVSTLIYIASASVLVTIETDHDSIFLSKVPIE